jgi:hypothetical protein
VLFVGCFVGFFAYLYSNRFRTFQVVTFNLKSLCLLNCESKKMDGFARFGMAALKSTANVNALILA